MKEGIQLPNEGPEASQAKQEQYQGMTRSFMFSMVETRPNIAFATSIVSRFAKNPSRQHTEVIKTILRYLKATKMAGIMYGGNKDGDLTIKAYSDSDWAGDHATRKSTSGFVFMLNGGPVSWSSKRQATVTLSSTEAEYMALTLAAKKAIWMRLLLTEIGLLDKDGQYAMIKVAKSPETEQIKADATEQEGEVINTLSSTSTARTSTAPTPISLKGDNQGSIALAHNPVFYACTVRASKK